QASPPKRTSFSTKATCDANVGETSSKTRVQRVQPRGPAMNKASHLSPPKRRFNKANWLAFQQVVPHQGRSPLPLPIGCFDQLRSRLPDIPTNILKRLIGAHCQSSAYLRALATPGATRHDLDGKSLEPVSEEHQRFALERLKRRETHKHRSTPGEAPNCLT